MNKKGFTRRLKHTSETIATKNDNLSYRVLYLNAYYLIKPFFCFHGFT